MAPPIEYESKLAISLPNEDEIRKVIGDDYDPSKALNVIKALAGTGDLFPDIRIIIFHV